VSQVGYQVIGKPLDDRILECLVVSVRASLGQEASA